MQKKLLKEGGIGILEFFLHQLKLFTIVLKNMICVLGNIVQKH